ncbi:hypothetical protein [Myxococcus qinghaiensis]|uniref:hypothetical protein n=1 Tax=Myxococcus qinghaiensis TaxID=2906758 RepID=UPI0020A7BC5C|nr:hypothetical protein [Myxococcus qinghaiensis]MCP3165880.1 hypothetical protein [Myxococcus qinghaiensis]
MPQSRPRLPGPHRIHYSPQAWREVGRMSAETFGALQGALERLGDGLVREPRNEASGTGRHELPRHGLVLDYAWDDRSRTLTLLSLEREP